jgi:tetratricopeptide (TPR) repeat protein
MRAWFSLTDGEYRAAIAAAQAGQQAAPHSDVAVHLAGQEAEAWARLGEEQAALEALDRGRRVLDQLAWPDNPRNHFTVDPPKFRWWRARVARFLGDDELAHHQASEIIAEGLRPDGTHRQPMRVADATATLGAIAAGRGDVDEAVRLGHEALTITERVSKPSLLAVTGEILDLLPNTPAAAELAHQLHEMTAVA